MTRHIASVALLIAIAACGGSGDGVTVDGITASRADGVWIFSHAPAAGMDALHGGMATIEDGCLLIDGAVVVFHETMRDDVIALIGSVRGGDAVVVTIPGGGVSLAEGGSPDDIPAVIAERCPTDTVWFGAGGTLEITG